MLSFIVWIYDTKKLLNKILYNVHFFLINVSSIVLYLMTSYFTKQKFEF